MNPIERVIVRPVDRFQQRHTFPAVVFAVTKKFGDDNAGALVSNLAYAGFAAVFPLLLLLVTILGIVLRGDASLRDQILHSTLSEFPIIGAQLGNNIHALQKGSSLALVIALLGLLWSSTGLAQAGLFAMAQVWDLPGPVRLNFIKRLGRSFAFLGVLALGIVVTTTLASFGTFSGHAWYLVLGAEIVAGLVNIGQYFLAFRVLTPKVVASRRLVPGAVFGGIGWTVLQALGGYFVGHQLKNTSQVYGTFALVLGLLAWIYIGVQLSVYAAEFNVVLAERLWPRSIVQPPLTDADERALAAQVTENQRRPEQQVGVSYSKPAPENHFEQSGRSA